jgi:hypothetical protein
MRLPKILKQSVLRLRCDELALWIGLSLEGGTAQFEFPIVRAFEHTFAKLKTLGNQDFAAYVLARLRQVTDGAATAASFLNDYARDRREKSPLPGFLLDLEHSLSHS